MRDNPGKGYREQEIQVPDFLRNILTAADNVNIDVAAVVDKLIDNGSKDIFLPARAECFPYDDAGNVVLACVIDNRGCNVKPEQGNGSGPQFLSKCRVRVSCSFASFESR